MSLFEKNQAKVKACGGGMAMRVARRGKCRPRIAKAAQTARVSVESICAGRFKRNFLVFLIVAPASILATPSAGPAVASDIASQVTMARGAGPSRRGHTTRAEILHTYDTTFQVTHRLQTFR